MSCRVDREKKRGDDAEKIAVVSTADSNNGDGEKK